MKFRNTSIIGLAVSAFIFIGILTGASVNIFGQEREEKPNPKLAKQAKITMEQARETALNQVPGKIESEELEKEHGILLYSFDIRNSKGTITEVQVDAKTGKFLSAKEETKADEEKEKREDEKKSKTKKPNSVSTIKDGTVKGVKTIGRGIQTAANKVAGVFTN